jgi:hypothetical protein
MENKTTTFTKNQIEQYKSYEIVRKSGSYNMFDSRARLASGLTKDEYLFVMENYSELKEATESFNADSYLLNQCDKS